MTVPKGKRPSPPTGMGRVLFRLPIHLYRAGLGPFLGGRFMLLTHTGRRSGLPRQTVIEVVGREAGPLAYIACSGFGPKADWYRNVLRNPEVTVQVGRHRMTAVAQPMPPEEGAEAMARYARRHPRAARKLAGFMGFKVDGTEAGYRSVGRSLPFVRFADDGGSAA